MQLGATLCRVQREDHFAELTSKLRPDMYMLLYFKWMMTKDLLYGTGNCAQCYVAAGMEGALGENGNTYTCGWVPLLSTWNDHNIVSQLCCCAVTKSGSTLCDPMDSSMPGSPVLHHLPKCAQVHVYWIGDAIETSHSLSPPSPPAFNLSQHQDLFQWVSSLHQVAKVLELSPNQNKMLKKKKKPKLRPEWQRSHRELAEEDSRRGSCLVRGPEVGMGQGSVGTTAKAGVSWELRPGETWGRQGHFTQRPCRARWQVSIKFYRSDGEILAIKGQRVFGLCRACGLCHSYATWLLSIKTNTSEWVQLGSNKRTFTSLEVDQIWLWLVACQPLWPKEAKVWGKGVRMEGETGATLLPTHTVGHSMWDLSSPAKLLGD